MGLVVDRPISFRVLDGDAAFGRLLGWTSQFERVIPLEEGGHSGQLVVSAIVLPAGTRKGKAPWRIRRYRFLDGK